MKKNLKTMVFLLMMLSNFGLYAQIGNPNFANVTLNVDGNNPHCWSQYPYPQGVPYNGTIFIGDSQAGPYTCKYIEIQQR